jgi:hypothetical protein
VKSAEASTAVAACDNRRTAGPVGYRSIGERVDLAWRPAVIRRYVDAGDEPEAARRETM